MHVPRGGDKEPNNMGIKNLSPFLRKQCPEAFSSIAMDQFAYTKIAVDAAIYVCELKLAAKEAFPDAMFKFVLSLRSKKIHPVFVFDGIAPPEKAAERQRRHMTRERQVARVVRLEEALALYEQTGELTEELRLLKEVTLHSLTAKRLLLLTTAENNTFDVQAAKDYLEKLRSKLFDVSDADFTVLKTILDLTKTPRLQAQGEAEALCAHLVKQGIVKAALTKDTDILAHGCPIMLNKVNYDEGCFSVVCLENILSSLELTYDQFVDLCIVCGTDFNKNIPKIGPHKAYDLIKRYGSIDGFPETIDVTLLNHHRVRDLFILEVTAASSVPYAATPNYRKLNTWMKANRVGMNAADIRKQLETNPTY